MILKLFDLIILNLCCRQKKHERQQFRSNSLQPNQLNFEYITNVAGITVYPISVLCWATDYRPSIHDKLLQTKFQLSENIKDIKYTDSNHNATIFESITTSGSVIGDLFEPKTCYELYVRSAINMFDQCKSHYSNLNTMEFNNFKATLRNTILKARKQILHQCTPYIDKRIDFFINELAIVSYIYEKCSYSSILRTGQNDYTLYIIYSSNT